MSERFGALFEMAPDMQALSIEAILDKWQR